MMTRFSSVASVAMLTAVASGCGNKGSATTPAPTAANPDQIQIGLVLSLTQGSSALGLDAQSGANIAAAQINAFGGILGKQIQLVVKDDHSDPATTLQIVNDLQQQGIVLGIGPSTGPEALGLASLIQGDQILYISPSATSQDLDGLGGQDGGAAPAMGTHGPVLFRTAPSDQFLATAMVQYATTGTNPGDPPRCPTIAIVAENDDYGNTTAAEASKLFAADTFFVTTGNTPVELNPTVTDFTTVAAQVGAFAQTGTPAKDAQCQVVIAQPAVAGAYMIAFSKFVLADSGHDWSKFLTIGSDGFRQNAFISAARTNPADMNSASAAEGTFAVAANTAPDPKQATQQYNAFLELYQAWYGATAKPGSFASTSYDAILMLAAAVQLAGSATDLPKIRQTLFSLTSGTTAVSPTNVLDMFTIVREGKNIAYSGASGPCSFLSTGGVLTDFGVWQIHNGAYTFITTYSGSEIEGTAM